ncbi:MAG: hypothetical protein WBA71_02175 [Candidatus Humimicrobiia bacterium]
MNQKLFENYEFIFIVVFVPLIIIILFYLLQKFINFISGKSTTTKSSTKMHPKSYNLQTFTIGYLEPILIVIILFYEVGLLFFGGLIVLSSLNGKFIAIVMTILILLFILGLILIYRMYSTKY